MSTGALKGNLTPPLLHPYDGWRTVEHLGSGRSPHSSHEIRHYGDDTTQTVTYRFNSLGFRGEEYRPESAKHIFVFGPSTCLGTGLAEEQIWPYQFKLAYARQQMLDADEVNLLNFGQGAANNAYAVRMALTQCARVAPDLAIVQFAPGHFRTEFFSTDILQSERHVLFGPWMVDAEGTAKPDFGIMGSKNDALLGAMEGYARYYSEETGVINSIKDLLLFQSWSANKHIDHMVCWGCGVGGASDVTPWSNHPSIGPLLNLVDWSRVYPVELMDLDMDRAADGAHPGAEACKKFAADLWEAYQQIDGKTRK